MTNTSTAMRHIFVDTGAFLGRYLLGDQHHAQALDLWDKVERESESCFTSNFVLDETFTFLARHSTYSYAAEKARSIYSSSAFLILRPDLEVELAAIRLFEKFADQEVSFTDCVSFVLMRQSRIRTAFAFDRHFEHAGFKLWK